MIKKLDVENFRSHGKTTLEFVKGINCIIGLPDSGKTNLIRAINWLLINRPLGFRFHSDFTDDPTKVAIQLENEDGSTDDISLIKSKKSAQYVLNKNPLKAIGSDVPDEISLVTQITDLNLQRQLDKPFLICSSSGEVAKTFNRVTKLEKPDIAISMLTTDINTENKTLKNLKERRDRTQEDIDKLGDVNGMKSSLEEMLTVNDKLAIKQNRIDKLNNIIADVDWHVKNVESLGNVDKVVDSFNKLIELDKKLNEVNSRITNLNGHVTEINRIQKTVTNIKDGLDKMLDSFDKVKGASKKWGEVVALKESLEESIRDVNAGNTLAEKAKEALLTKAREYRKFLNTINICPYCVKCKTPISEHNLDDAIKGLEI
jgi:DNA repair protein SbcC/Rad50